MPRVARFFRGGDDRLLSGVASLFEEGGLRIIGVREVAPEILVPEGVLGRYQPSARDRADIARALKVIAALGPFDVGQAAVVADNHVLAVEAAEGTDNMLARVAELRRQGRVTTPPGVGVSRQSAEARSGSPLRPARDRAANRRERRARGPCRAGRRRRQHDHRRSRPKVTAAADRAKIFSRRRGRGRGAMNDAPQPRPLSIYLVAAEESGDALGAALGARAAGA